MFNEHEILLNVEGVSAVQLKIWVTEEWIRPLQTGTVIAFNEADVARIRLIDLLHNQLQVNEEAIPIILSLIDQAHDLKEQMRLVASAIADQPDDVRSKILKAVREKCALKR